MRTTKVFATGDFERKLSFFSETVTGARLDRKAELCTRGIFHK